MFDIYDQKDTVERLWSYIKSMLDWKNNGIGKIIDMCVIGEFTRENEGVFKRHLSLILSFEFHRIGSIFLGGKFNYERVDLSIVVT